MYRLIASDSDETLIGHDHLIHKQDELAIKAAKEKEYILSVQLVDHILLSLIL